VFNTDLDAKNTESFLSYTDPEIYKRLVHQKIRKVGSFKQIAAIQQISEIYTLLGHHDTYAVNYYQNRTSGWATKTAGWDNTRGFSIQPFRYIDFLNVLLGTYRSGTSIALTEKHQSHIPNIRIDYDFDNYSGQAAVRLATEIQDKLADIGLDCFFISTGNRGIQAIIPLPVPVSINVAKQCWQRLKQYLDTNIAIQDKCSLDSFLRLPLGIHASSNNLSLFFSTDTEAYVSHIDQLLYFKNSWQWEMPIHLSNALDVDAFNEQVDKGFTFVPDTKTISTVVKPSQSKLPRNNDWASKVWEMRLQLKPGMWQQYLLEDDAIHAAYILFGDSALSKLEELATQIPAKQSSDIQDRLKRVRYLWGKFNPIQLPKDSSPVLTLMMKTEITTDTYAEANLLFNYLQSKKTTTTRWVNKNAEDYILAVLHGINCSNDRSLTITVDELLIYLQEKLSSISRRTLLRIIQKSTIPPPPIGRPRPNYIFKQNELAVFTYDPGKKIFIGSTPGTYSRVTGLRRSILKEQEDSKPVGL
jgi:hypothetical protein